MNNLIIPMAGKGERFVRAGYKTYKPFLFSKDSKTILENIFNKFGKKTRIIFIVSNKLNNKYLIRLKNVSKARIIKIPPHKLGPGYSIIKAEKKLKKLKNIYVSYSDIEWIWGEKMETLNNNIVYCFKGYHPFTYDNNNYAFCKVGKNKKFIKLREKFSFTNKWASEPLSIGLFFYKNSENLLGSLKELKKKNIKTNNEFFPSEGFNFLKNNSSISYVKNFVHLGNPQYYEIYKNWLFFFKNNLTFKKKINKTFLADKIIIPAAGDSKRFKREGIKIDKFMFFIKSVKKTLLIYLCNFLPKQKKFLILKKNSSNVKNNLKGFEKIILKKKSKGQAHTIFMSLNKLEAKQSIFINSCDVFSIFDINKFISLKKNADIIVFLSSKSFINLHPNEYTWATTQKNEIGKLHIKKRPNKIAKIVTGNFYFKNKEIFYKSFRSTNFSHKEMYIDEMINSAIRLGFKVKFIEDYNYINLGTPKLIKDFSYWHNYFIKNE